MNFKLEKTRISVICLISVLFLAQVEASITNRFVIPERFKSSTNSVFSSFGSVLSKYKVLDVAKGQPNFKPPEILSNALVNASLGDYTLSQYSRDVGLPRLVTAIAKFYSKLMNRSIDPLNEVITTSGATQALFTAFQTHTSPGDEWIVIEPTFPAYELMIKAAYGVPKFISLKPKKNLAHHGSSRDWTFNRDELSKLFNYKTKGIVLNTPHNPTGKVFTYEELEFIANLTKKWNTLVISDEVYEFLTFDQNEHVRIASLPGMFERTITIGSGGKSFSVTGLRCGWAFGGAKILENLKLFHMYGVVNAPTLVQEAFAVTFENEIENFGTAKSYLHEFRKAAESKRNDLVKSLTDFGMTVSVPEGGYFLMANWTTMAEKVDLRNETDNKMDFRFVKWMIKNVGVFALPMSGFYGEQNNDAVEDVLRFTFIKTDELLEDVENCLHEWTTQKTNCLKIGQNKF